MAQAVEIIDPGFGNLKSLARAVARLTGQVVTPTRDPDRIRCADRLLLPGDGSFRAAIAGLAPLRDALEEAVMTRGRPCLGICVGLQVMAQFGEEQGEQAGLGWLPGRVAPLADHQSAPEGELPASPFDSAGRHRQKRLHLGWSRLERANAHPCVPDGNATMFFIHGFGLSEVPDDFVIARSRHLRPFVAIAARDQVLGVQFHPEKSQAPGLALLDAFLSWAP